MNDGSNTWNAAREARDRIVNLLRERDGINEDIKELVEEVARVTGYTKTHVRKAAMIEKKGREEYEAEQAVFHEFLYHLNQMAEEQD